MNRGIAIVGAPSSIGIKPYADGTPRLLDLAPAVLREAGLCSRLYARDLGDVLPPSRYQDVDRPHGRPRNEQDLIWYSQKIAERVAAASSNGQFVLLLGGDCSILLGALLGLQTNQRPPAGLVYFDAHADFATLESSPSGSAASMCLALATGQNDTPLAHLAGNNPLVRLEDLVHIGRRDDHEPWYGHGVLSASPALNLSCSSLRAKGTSAAAHAALQHVVRQPNSKFWIHLDADVLDPATMPAVDSPLPGGLDMNEIAELLDPLVHHPGALGLQLTIYDPSLDPDRSCANRLVALLERVLGRARSQAGSAS
jgi:arginase